MMVGAEVIVDNILCFLSTAAKDFSEDTLFDLAYCFYSYEKIKESKATISNLLKKDISSRRDPEKKKKELTDVTTLMKELKESEIKVKFVSDSYKGMPPVGFEFIAPLIANLSEEVTKINTVLPSILDIKSEVRNTTDTVRQMKVEVRDIGSKFTKAVAGIEEAANDITNDLTNEDLEIISDIKSFRNSSNIGRLSFGSCSGAAAAGVSSVGGTSSAVEELSAEVATASGVTTKENNHILANRRSSNNNSGSLSSPTYADTANKDNNSGDGNEWTLVNNKKKRTSPHRVGNTGFRVTGS